MRLQIRYSTHDYALVLDSVLDTESTLGPNLEQHTYHSHFLGCRIFAAT